MAVVWIRSIGHMGSVYWIGSEHSVQVEQVDGVVGIILAHDSGLRPPVSGTERLYGWFSWRAALPSDRDRASLSIPSFNRWGFGTYVHKTVGRPQGWWRFGGR